MKREILENVEYLEGNMQGQSITLQIVKGTDGISEFNKDWDDLFTRAVNASPYLSRSWISTFIEEGRLHGTALFILAWHGVELIGMLPLAVHKFSYGQRVEPIGTSVPSYLGLLLDPNFPEVAAYIARAFQKEKIANLIYIEDLWSADDATNMFLNELEKRNFSVRRVCRNPCLFIRLDGSYEEYLQKTKSSKSRKTLRWKERQLHKKYVVDIERYDKSEITDSIIDRIASIQEQSWMKRRGAAIFGQPFYHKLLLNVAQAGLARTWLMTIDGADAAFVLAFVAHGKLYYAWTAFKLEYASPLSVGQILTGHVIDDTCRDDISWFDFSHGDAEYKRFWSTDEHSVYRAVAGRGVLGRILCNRYYLVWQLKRIKWMRSFYYRLKNVPRCLKQKIVRN